MTRLAALTLVLTLAGGIVSRAQDQAAEQPAPAAVLLENHGRPIELPFRCTGEDIRWAGLGCSEEEPCPIFLELSAAAHWGERTVVSGNIHSESATLYSVLLSSENGGQTWSEAHPPIRGAAVDHIQYLDSGLGWIGGEEQFPLPQNPFLLLTADGGKTWTERAVLHESTESPFGAVVQFFFSSNSAGSLVLDRGQGSGQDRYALFQSENGGQSWTIRQQSAKPIRLPQTVSAIAWRVRADRASQSYQIEHLEGERWSSIAAFAVNLAACKPPPAEPDAEKP
ncbi:MAG: hypothetical protein ABSH42_02585 [Bryobacteraceae bacterium]